MVCATRAGQRWVGGVAGRAEHAVRAGHAFASQRPACAWQGMHTDVTQMASFHSLAQWGNLRYAANAAFTMLLRAQTLPPDSRVSRL